MRLFIAFWVFLVTFQPILAQDQDVVYATLDRVVDGDTIVVRVNSISDISNPGALIKIRLKDVDAPESSQPYGKEATQFLKDSLGSGEIKVKFEGTDPYHRALGWIYSDNLVEVNSLMVERGYAWSYKHKNRRINQLEDFARTVREGLWNQESPEAPWEYRRRKKLERQQLKKEAVDLGNFCISHFNSVLIS